MGCRCRQLVRPTYATSPSERRNLTTGVCYRPGADGPPARTPSALLVPALPDVAWTECGASCVWLVDPRICWQVGGTRDIPVEALFPQGGGCLELASSSLVAGLGNRCRWQRARPRSRVASRCAPDWLDVTLAGAILDLVGDQLGSFCQVDDPDGMGKDVAGMLGARAVDLVVGVSAVRRQ
jgi:hypothetical protein